MVGDSSGHGGACSLRVAYVEIHYKPGNDIAAARFEAAYVLIIVVYHVFDTQSR